MALVNPDQIQAGDEVTLSFHGSSPVPWTVIERRGTALSVEHAGDIKTVQLAGKRTDYQVVDHKPWMS